MARILWRANRWAVGCLHRQRYGGDSIAHGQPGWVGLACFSEAGVQKLEWRTECVYLEHGLFYASCLDDLIPEEVLYQLRVRLATASPGHCGIEQVLRVRDERF